MKIIYLSYTDTKGKRFNGFDLANYLQQNDHNCYMYVDKKLSEKPWARSIYYPLNYNILSPLLFLIRGIERFLSVHSLFYPAPLFFLIRKQFYKSDIVHLHLLQNNWFSILFIPIISKIKPTVWTLHNPWHITGHCVHPVKCKKWITGCKKCNFKSRQWKVGLDTSHMQWKIKKWIFNHSNINIIVSSKWMKNLVEKSPITKNKKVNLIPFGIDTNKFYPYNKRICKDLIKIPAKSLVIGFRDCGEDEFKGTDVLEAALLNLKARQKIHLLIFDAKSKFKKLADKFSITELEWVDSDTEMMVALNATDIFVNPSVAESFGMMALEAMACGTPVITTQGIATEEVIQAPKAGLAINLKNLTDAIQKLISNKKLRIEMGKQGKRIACKKYNLSKYLNNHLKLYKKIIKSKNKTTY